MLSLARWVAGSECWQGFGGVDLSLDLAVLPDNCEALEAAPHSQTFLSTVNMIAFKVTEVPFGSDPLWFFLLSVSPMLSWESWAGFVLGFSTPSD